MTFTPSNKLELKKAINLYYKNKDEGIKKYGEINTWNTENITDMCWLFGNFCYFNEEISNWNTINVVDMSYMFYQCHNFNKPINFNSKNVENMSYMFYNCNNFNKPVILNTNKAKNIQNMFLNCNKLCKSIIFIDDLNHKENNSIYFLNNKKIDCYKSYFYKIKYCRKCFKLKNIPLFYNNLCIKCI